MLVPLILLAAGFAFLIKGADALVSGASSLARRFGYSNLVVGLTIVAFGTSMPELVVDVFASLRRAQGIVLGDVLGSSIANIGLILGIAAAVRPLVVQRSTVWREIPLAGLAATLVLIMANDGWLDGRPTDLIGRGDGLVLLAFFPVFLFYVFSLAQNGTHIIRHDHDAKMPKDVVETALSVRRSVVSIAVGIVALSLGGLAVVEGAVRAALLLGVPNRIVALSIVALGTSLPELATSLVAVLRRQADVAVGNIVGSNIFNVFFVLGISAVINRMSVSPSVVVDMLVALGMTALLFFFMFIGRRHVLERWQGVLLVALYVGYLGFVFVPS